MNKYELRLYGKTGPLATLYDLTKDEALKLFRERFTALRKDHHLVIERTS